MPARFDRDFFAGLLRPRRPPPLTLRKGQPYNRASFRTDLTARRRAAEPITRPVRGGSVMEATTTKKLVDYRVKNGVAWLELTDPPANTYTYEMMRDLDEAILQARFDEAVHVLVLRGAGEKFFCAGANINMLKTVNPTFKYFFCLHANETLNRLEHTPKLVIAALNGHTVGGGLEIAMAADIRIARKGAGKAGLPEVSLGVLPGTGGTQRLARLINKSTAIELMTTGETFDFEKAQSLGIINQIWDTASNDEFIEKIQKYAEQFCPPNKAAKAVGRIKRSVQSGVEVAFESALAIERELQQQLFQSEDAKEGLSAYVEKRKPNFGGR
jgi:enoyl-CoA hydratase